MGTSPAYAAKSCLGSLAAYGAAWDLDWVARFPALTIAASYGAAL